MNRDLKIEILKKFDSQADFAMAVNTHDTKVSMVLHGRRQLPKEEASRWLEVLKCKPEIIAKVTKNGETYACQYSD